MGTCSSKSAAQADTNELRAKLAISELLEDQFNHFLNTGLYDLYLENFLRQTVLPDRTYLKLALDLILKVDIDATSEEKKFAMLVALYSRLGKTARLKYINQINQRLLPESWQEDFLFWNSLSRNESVSSLTSNNTALKSWQMMIMAMECLENQKPNYETVLSYHEKSLELNPKNTYNIIGLFYNLTKHEFPIYDAARAEQLMLDSIARFSDNTIVALWLKALLARKVYMLEHLDKSPLAKQKIANLGFDVNEPYLKQVLGELIYHVKGKNANKDVWYYILVRPSELQAFLRALNNDQIHLLHHGKVLYSGSGEKAPDRVTKAIREKYIIDAPDIPNALQKLLETHYASAVAERLAITSATPRSGGQVTETADEEKKDAFDVDGSSPVTIFIPKDKIHLKRELGRGSFGIVHEAEWNFQTVAVKCYAGTRLPERIAAEIRHEVAIMLRLQHECLVRLWGLVQENSHPAMLVMEYGANGSLYDYLKSNQAISWSTRLRLAKELSRGLAYLHQENIVHRDIKSLNIILDRDFHAKWCDFGLAALKSHSTTTSSNRVGQQFTPVGTTLWMAPELFIRGTSSPSKPADIWALGMVFFELASRLVPWHDGQSEEQIKDWIKEGKGETVPEECKRKSPGFAAMMQRCWLDRNSRPTAKTLIEEFDQLPCSTT